MSIAQPSVLIPALGWRGPFSPGCCLIHWSQLSTFNLASILQVSGIFAVRGGSEITVYGHGHDLHCQHLEYRMIQPSHETRRQMGWRWEGKHPLSATRETVNFPPQQGQGSSGTNQSNTQALWVLTLAQVLFLLRFSHLDLTTFFLDNDCEHQVYAPCFYI